MSTYDIKSQIAVAKLLPEILTKGAREYLPALLWTIGFNGVTGEVPGVIMSAEEQREAFDGWVKVIGADASEGKVSGDGTTHLRAGRTYPPAGVVVVLRAKIEPTS